MHGALRVAGYRIDQCVERSSVGTFRTAVYRGVREDDGAAVAIKEYRVDRRARPFLERRLQALVKIGAAKPDSALALPFALVDRFAVMPWIDGRPLSSVIANGGALGVKRALGIASLLARASQRLARAGRTVLPTPLPLGHGDLHLDNVLLTARGPRVIDFDFVGLPLGRSFLTPDVKRRLAIPYLGWFQPPEVLFGAVPFADAKADVFAIGALFVWMACGRSPFAETTYLDVMRGWASGGRAYPKTSSLTRALGRRLRPTFRAIVGATLCFDRARRSTVDDLGRLLANARSVGDD